MSRVITEARPLLDARDLRVAYGAVRAVQGISFAVREGEIVTLIGPNGAGKSSTLRGLAGLAPVTGGTVELEGQDLLRVRPHRRPGRGLVLVPEGRRVFGELSVHENLLLGGHTRPVARQAANLRRVYELFPVLEQRQRQTSGTLSGGEQQMLAIGRALMAEPRVLLLDEPSLGLAPRIVAQVLELLRTLRAQGMTILLVEQNVRLALAVADRGYLLQTGHIVGSGRAAELAASDEVRRRYLAVAEAVPSGDGS